MDIVLKCCTKCKQKKPATSEYFHKHPRGVNGLHPVCKDCRSTAKPPKPPEDTRQCAICKERFPATPEYFYPQKEKPGGIRYYCRKCSSKKASGYRNADLEKNHQQQKALREKHHEYQINRLLKYRQSYPEKYLAYNRNRAARKKAVAGKHTPQQIQEQYERQGKKCYYCHKKLIKFHVDHVVPISRGGSNDPDNLVITCAFCNQSKHDRLPHEWPEGGRLL